MNIWFLVIVTIMQTHVALPLIAQSAELSCVATSVAVAPDDELSRGTTEGVEAQSLSPPHQLDCKSDPSICNKVCGEPKRLPYSSTFCDRSTGSCFCDCRDKTNKDCPETPFTPCFQNCVKMNPNPDVFLYKGGNCPISSANGTTTYQCACFCTVRDDYEETNDIFDSSN